MVDVSRAELLADVATVTGRPEMVVRANRFIEQAERYLNKHLTVADMEDLVTLVTDVDGYVLLPTDFVTVRTVHSGDTQFSGQSVTNIKNGSRHGYTIVGKKLRSYPRGLNLELRYYKELPSLNTSVTNWLLETDYDLYLHSVSFQVYKYYGDLEKAVATKAFLDESIADLVSADINTRYRNAEFVVQGVNP